MIVKDFLVGKPYAEAQRTVEVVECENQPRDLSLREVTLAW